VLTCGRYETGTGEKWSDITGAHDG
jgi:hypothetical protein